MEAESTDNGSGELARASFTTVTGFRYPNWQNMIQELRTGFKEIELFVYS